MAARIDPEVAAAEMREARLEPLEPYPGSKTPWRCRCIECDREVRPRRAAIKAGQGGCVDCGHRRRAEGRRIDPNEAVANMRAAGVEPLEPYTNVETPWLSRCLTCGEEVTPNLRNVRKGHGGCAYCAGKRISSEDALAIARAAGVEPLEPYRGSKTPWRSLCLTCEREVMPTLDSMVAGRGGCQTCGWERGAAQRRTDSSIAVREMSAAGAEPIESYKNSGTPWQSRCLTCEQQIAPTLSSVRAGHRPCFSCATKDAGKLRRIDADIAEQEMRAAGVEPLEPYPGSSAPWRSRCLTCAKTIAPTFGNVRGGHRACMYCSGRAPLDPEDAASDMRAAGVEPLEPYPGTGNPWKSRCLSCDREVSPRLNNIRNGSGACVYCAPTGFQHDKPATLYLFQHPKYRALKIGITNDTTTRLAVHERKGWRLIDMWFFEVGVDAFAAERLVLDEWAGYEHGVDRDDMPQAGYTETVSLDDVTEDEAVALIEDLIAVAGE